jgi:uncharacterized membrane protein YhhN
MTAALVAITAVLVGLLVWKANAAPTLAGIIKMAASTGFVAVALSSGAGTTTYGRFVLVALALSWLGDLFLGIGTDRAFLAGLVAFLAAHVAYIAAFAVRGIDPTWFVVAAVVLGAIAVVVWRWLAPHVADGPRQPVQAYIAVITLMVAAAIGTVAVVPDARIVLGSVAFFLSDIAVARNRFVAPGSVNRSVGLPLYYTGQVLLALSVG